MLNKLYQRSISQRDPPSRHWIDCFSCLYLLQPGPLMIDLPSSKHRTLFRLWQHNLLIGEGPRSWLGHLQRQKQLSEYGHHVTWCLLEDSRPFDNGSALSSVEERSLHNEDIRYLGALCAVLCSRDKELDDTQLSQKLPVQWKKQRSQTTAATIHWDRHQGKFKGGLPNLGEGGHQISCHRASDAQFAWLSGHSETQTVFGSSTYVL